MGLSETFGKIMLLGEFVQGYLDYFRFPELRDGFGGPLNGQFARQQLFFDIVKSHAPQVIVETGTFRGTTTAMFAKCGLPVFTIEADARNFGFAFAQLHGIGNVSMRLGDSSVALKKLFHSVVARHCDKSILVYLDAHGNEELPLAQELDVVFTNAPKAIVMIDDFEVPFDPGYRFDDYGPDEALTASYIEPLVRKHRLAKFYPSTPSAEESGHKRGCVVVCKESVHGSTLKSLDMLSKEVCYTDEPD